MQPNHLSPTDRRPKLNSITTIIMIVLSITALLAVLSGFAFPAQVRETDEGSAAHIFQLSIAALVPTLLAFFLTADWQKPSRTVRPLIFSAAIVTVAFAALFYLEHYR